VRLQASNRTTHTAPATKMATATTAEATSKVLVFTHPFLRKIAPLMPGVFTQE